MIDLTNLSLACIKAVRRFPRRGFAPDGSDILSEVYLRVTASLDSKAGRQMNDAYVRIATEREAVRTCLRHLRGRWTQSVDEGDQ